MEELKAADIGNLLRGRMGLIIGPSLTKHPRCLSEVSESLASKYSVNAGDTYLTTADAVIEKGTAEEEVRNSIRTAVDEQKQSSLLSQISKVRWAAVLSASIDAHFEDSFRQEADRRGTWQSITVLSDLMTPPPPRTIPVFKLLGLATRGSFASSTVSYLDRRATWRHAVKGFGDLVKGSLVLCLGMGDSTWVLTDLITEMLGDRSALPSALVILADDAVCGNSRVRQLLNRRVKLLTIRGTVGDVARAAAAAEKGGFPQIPAAETALSDPLAKIRRFEDIAALVNDHVEARIEKSEQLRLRDLLFSPAVPRWDPFVHGLDFRRPLGTDLLGQLREAAADPDPESVASVLFGGAVTGKTMVLKRVALDLAKAGLLVLWLKPWSYQDGPKFLRDLFKEVAGAAVTGGARAVVVMDDPLGFGSLSPRDVALAAKASGARILLVTGFRTSEWGTWERTELVGGLPVVAQVELPDDLDDAEWAALPGYLAGLGVATSLGGVRGHSARDTLSMLYWLLPETRAGIGSSIRDEYHRLGDVAGLAKMILGTVNHDTGVLKSAYEMVAVADHYRASLPIEVLVSALGIPYSEWIDATKPDSAAWGLFYSEDSEDGQTVHYRTRNSIVTRMIVEAVNGGTLGRTGELRVMTRLLRACGGRTSSVYREFCVRVLVPHEKLERLEYAEGLQLYDDAIGALPHPDKTLVHHKGLWVKNKGRDAAQAEAILQQALQTPVFPYASRGEADGHIHTSIAAAVLDGVNQGTETLEEGKTKILSHLSQARSIEFFNPRAVHVQANLISHLADKVPDAHSPDYYALINQAVGDVDHTLLLLQNEAVASTHAIADVKMLEQIRGTVLMKVSSADDLKAEAEKSWVEFGSQEGFVLVSRKLYAAAQEKGKRFDVAYSYCGRAIDRIIEEGQQPSPALYAIAVQIYYFWRVRRQTFSGTGSIGWATLRDYAAPVVASTRYGQDPLYKHIYALSLAHLGNWSEANALYAQLRLSGMPNHVLWKPRDFLLNESGGVRTVQGLMRAGAGDREFIYVEDLGADFHVDRKSRWPREGEIAHAAIQFAFGGINAVESRQLGTHF